VNPGFALNLIDDGERIPTLLKDEFSLITRQRFSRDMLAPGSTKPIAESFFLGTTLGKASFNRSLS
jgi:hypothetical protein